MLQTLGVAGAVPALVMAAWGWRLIGGRGLSPVWVRSILAVAATILLAIAASVLPGSGFWPLTTNLGGAVGDLALVHLTTVLGGLGYGMGAITVAITCAVMGTLAVLFAAGLSWREWRSIGRPLVMAPAAVLGWLGRQRAGNTDNRVWLKRSEPPLAAGEITVTRLSDEPRTRARVVTPRAKKPKTGKRRAASNQGILDLGSPDEYRAPPLGLLDGPREDAGVGLLSKEALEENARLLESVLEDFGVRGEIVKVCPGPVVTLYELEPAPGTKTSRVIGLSDDIARSMSAVSVRSAVIPGRNVIGIELPNARREMVCLRELLDSDDFRRFSGGLNLPLGKDIGGAPMTVDLSRMPHLLIAGTTGSGKSVALNTMILGLLYSLPPEACRFIMIDPKMLELSVYEGIPHLLCPVVTEPAKAVVALKWAVREMEERYRAMSQLGVRNIAGYNARLGEARRKSEALTRRVQTGFDEDGSPVFEEQPLDLDPLPFIVVVVDEMADLMLVAGKDIEGAVQRLSQMARAAGIHLIMATQRPSVDVITGTIKANFPTRVSFQVTSKVDSRTILGEQGAEQLLGQGDMLFMAGGGRITRVHGPFVSDQEVERVVEFLRSQGRPEYDQTVTEEIDDGVSVPTGAGGAASDPLYDQALAVISREGKASTSFIQRHLQIGYNRAARIIERMEKEGIVSKANRVGRREVLLGQG